MKTSIKIKICSLVTVVAITTSLAACSSSPAQEDFLQPARGS